MLYLVQEFVAHKWWTVRSFNTEANATAFAKVLGYKTRIITREVVRS